MDSTCVAAAIAPGAGEQAPPLLSYHLRRLPSRLVRQQQQQQASTTPVAVLADDVEDDTTRSGGGATDEGDDDADVNDGEANAASESVSSSLQTSPTTDAPHRPVRVRRQPAYLTSEMGGSGAATAAAAATNTTAIAAATHGKKGSKSAALSCSTSPTLSSSAATHNKQRSSSPSTRPFSNGMPGEVDGSREKRDGSNTTLSTDAVSSAAARNSERPRRRAAQQALYSFAATLPKRRKSVGTANDAKKSSRVTAAAKYQRHQPKQQQPKSTKIPKAFASSQPPQQQQNNNKRSASVSSTSSSWSQNSQTTTASNKNSSTSTKNYKKNVRKSLRLQQDSRKRGLRRRNSQGRVEGSRTYLQTEMARYDPSWSLAPKRQRRVGGVPVITEDDYDIISKRARLDRPSRASAGAATYDDSVPVPFGTYAAAVIEGCAATLPAQQLQPIADINNTGEFVSTLVAPADIPQAGIEKLHIDMIKRDILQRNIRTKWTDIAGLESVKVLLQEACVLPFVFPKYFVKIRRPWKGVLLYGPPGVGKTMLAKAVAHECHTTFFNVSLATIMSQWVGESEKLMRVLFEMARHYAPSTIFIDEVDAIFSKRGGSDEHEAARRIRGEFLVQMDGLLADLEDCDRAGRHVTVLAATNCPWELEEAIRRRLEKSIYIPLPDLKARERVFELSMEGIELAPDVNFNALAQQLEGFSGSDITTICRDAALRPLRTRITGLSLAEVRKLPKRGIADRPVAQADFLKAMSTAHRIVSDELVDKYSRWTENNAFE